MNCEATKARARKEPIDDMEPAIAAQTLFSFVKLPTVFPYAIPGSIKRKVMRMPGKKKVMSYIYLKMK